MKVLLLNGSPRKGNVYTALKALRKGFAKIDGLEIDEVIASNLAVSPCLACGSCRDSGQCVFDDETNELMNTVLKADIVVFATPVYWWGITAQLKLVIDKFYSCIEQLSASKKQVGVIVIGQLPQQDVQYELISKQFACISDYLGWNIAFCNTYSAYEESDLAGDENAIAEIEDLWKKIK